MKTKLIRKILRTTIITFLVLAAVLFVHIYVVTRPKVDAYTRIMARIDIKQAVGQQDADKITAWLYQQKGVDHVLCNPKTEMVVFSYSPMLANGNEIAKKFTAELNYPNAKRFIPTADQLKGSCPVASSFTYKVYSYFKHLF